MALKLNSRFLLLAVFALLAASFVSLGGANEAHAKALVCSKDKRDGILLNDGGRKCLKALKVYNRAVIRDGYFRPYGSACKFSRGQKNWRCQAGAYRTMNIEQYEFSRGYVYRKNGRFHAHVTYPSSPF